MRECRFARFLEDVTRLAPVAGHYWVRREGGEWFVLRLDAQPPRLWIAQGNPCDLLFSRIDDEMLGHEIVGPIDEPD